MPIQQSDEKRVLQVVVDRYFANMRMIESIAKTYGVNSLFVVQPVPTYKYDLRYHLFAKGGFGRHSLAKNGYEYIQNKLHDAPKMPQILWLADIQDGIEKPLYLDQVHYTAEMCELIAGKIADRLEADDVVDVRKSSALAAGNQNIFIKELMRWE